jgi:hypothetical protein
MMYNKDVMKKENLYRTQVLLEPQQYRELTSLAEGEGISLSALLRRIVAQGLAINRQQQMAHAAEEMMDLYYSDGGMVGYVSLDGEDFPRGGGAA